LGSRWTYIDRDVLIEQGVCAEAKSDITLEERIDSIKSRVIIDAQVLWREKRKGVLYFLVLPLLELLLQRDAERTILHKRDKSLAKACREYVIETHETLDKIEKAQFDYCFDLPRQVSFHDKVNKIITFIPDRPQVAVFSFIKAQISESDTAIDARSPRSAEMKGMSSVVDYSFPRLFGVSGQSSRTSSSSLISLASASFVVP
jgi:hypothetical protein